MGTSDFPRGSEWRRWDLHIHTKGTQKNDLFTSETFEDFCLSMFQKALHNNISAIGITDYFNLDNYKKVKQYVDGIDSNPSFDDPSKERIKNIFLLPNVELRILPATDSGSLINIHCLFNPDEDFLSSLDNDFFGSLVSTEGYKMNRQGMIDLGRSLDSALQGNQAYTHGINHFHIAPKQLIDLLKDKPKHKENVIVAVANSNHDGASAIQEHYKLFENESGSLDSVRRSIYMASDVIFSSNPADREFFLGQKPGTDVHTVIHKCGSLKACIHGSDAHTEEKLFNPDKNRFCWIKADTTFEGLKQIICEPADRVMIQSTKPEEKSGYQVIESISINHKLCNQKILLNSNLNTIIGGRSTGKSTLLKLIALAINPKADVDELHIKDIAREGVSVKWQDSEENKARDIEFFKQNHMYDIARETEKKDKLIEGIVREKDVESALSTYESFCGSNKSAIQTHIDDLFELQTEQNSHTAQLKEKGDREGIEKEIRYIEQKIKAAHDDDFSESDLEAYESAKKNLLEKEQALTHAQKDKHEIGLLKDEDLFDQSFIYKLNALSDNTAKEIEGVFAKIKEEAHKDWQEKLAQKITTLEELESSLQGEIDQIKKSAEYLKGESHQAKNKQYGELSDRLKIERKKLDEILSIQKQIDQLEQQKQKLYSSVVEHHLSYLSKINGLINDFDLQHEDIQITIEKLFNKRKCTSLLEDFLNLQLNANKALVEDWTSHYEENTKEKVESFLSQALDDSIVLKSYKEVKDLAKGLLTANWHSISYKLTYQGDTFERMSDGKKAFVVLKLLLEFSDKESPILIDQPEDSLDNRAIYNELVTYLKQKKKDRQIILVTHNANIVVNADAEEVIVSNQHGDDAKNHNDIKFQYISGSIENTAPKDENIDVVLESQGIREHVCEILEGGTDAFKKRENKYSIGNIHA